MNLSYLTQKVDELWVRELVHPLFVSHGVNDSHLWLSKHNAKDLIWHIQLALTSQGNTLFKIYLFFLRMDKVIVSGLQDFVVSIQKLGDKLVTYEHFSEIWTIYFLRIGYNLFCDQNLYSLTRCVFWRIPLDLLTTRGYGKGDSN